ncbi:MAG TPA: cbb3-type cytochrome c oxidase subunit II [Candidatus Udaeobacter sp.]|nr:cbb3-type cytochrome c oxidase subunit II [Candidatus Udaeobacter sp.]
MKGLAPLFIGIFGTFAFSWLGLTVIPNWQIGALNPQSDEEGTDIYPMPQSGMVTRGARVYAANGCNYCHSEQVRPVYAGSDIERKWGNRRSAPRDYIFDRPVLLGKMRMGQDLANIGARAPAEQESPAPAGSPAAQGATGSSPAAPGAGATTPAAAPGTSPGSVATKSTSPAPAVGSAPSPPTAPPGASPAAAAIVSGGSPPPAPPSGLASPSPGRMGTNTMSLGEQPGTATAPSSGPQIAGPPWPEQTVGLPPMYSAAWHHVHLYSPRSINFDSNMPSYRFLYKTRRISDARSSDALHLTGSDAPPQGWEVVPTYDAKCLVAYMMALNQSHPLKEVRSAGAPAAASPAASPSPAAGGQPAK